MWVTNNTDELYHYGVLGMKWGVRRGRVSESYAKASAKLKKLDSQVEKKRAKAREAAIRAERIDRKLLAFNRKSSKAKAEKTSYEAAKQTAKAKKWYDQMEKTFEKTSISMTAEQQAMGKKYTDALNLRAELRYVNY